MAGGIFGIQEAALRLRAQRAELLATNIANDDTPNYKARDIDFKATLKNFQHNTNVNLRGTDGTHRMGTNYITKPQLMYRNPLQPSADGNTVESDVEKMKFMENSNQYLTTLSFLNGKIRTLQTALKGE